MSKKITNLFPALTMVLIAPLISSMHKAHAQATQLPANQAYFMLVNQNSGNCVDLINGSTADQAVVNQYSYDSGNSAQLWAFVPVSSHFEIVSWVTGKALTVSSAQPAAARRGGTGRDAAVAGIGGGAQFPDELRRGDRHHRAARRPAGA